MSGLPVYSDTPAGPMALVLVGAMIVGSVETTWAGVVGTWRGVRFPRVAMTASKHPSSLKKARKWDGSAWAQR